MSLTPSTMIDLGFTSPGFELQDTASGQRLKYDQVRGEHGTLIMFICNHCPFVIHVVDELAAIGRDFMPKGIGVAAISSNDVENYPQDGPERMHEFCARYEFPFPYLYDESQEVARAFDAACTPDFFLFDKEDTCVYRGRLDGSRPGNDFPVNGEDLRSAMQNVLSGMPIRVQQKPSMGCNIKWKS